jgi:hypothetical protein
VADGEAEVEGDGEAYDVRREPAFDERGDVDGGVCEVRAVEVAIFFQITARRTARVFISSPIIDAASTTATLKQHLLIYDK